jgi:hypothetical protein
MDRLIPGLANRAGRSHSWPECSERGEFLTERTGPETPSPRAQGHLSSSRAARPTCTPPAPRPLCLAQAHLAASLLVPPGRALGLTVLHAISFSGQLGKHLAGPFRGSESHDGMEGGLRTRELDRISVVISKTGAGARATRESIADARMQRMTKGARRSLRFLPVIKMTEPSVREVALVNPSWTGRATPSLFEVREPNPITINIPSEHRRQRGRTPPQVFLQRKDGFSVRASRKP